MAAAWSRLPEYLGQHVVLSAAALILGLVISLPLSMLAARRGWLRWPLLTGTSLIQTIPSLALLALFYPLLLGISALAQRLFGTGFSALGFLPALAALTLYSMLPVVRNTIVGLAGVDSTIVEAARGVGMTDRQLLFKVELPIAAPVILAGIRTSAVWVIGTATLSTPIGQTSLGNYIFTGLQTENWIFVLFGCASAAVLALLTDQLLGLIESGLARRDSARIMIGSAGLSFGILLALLPGMAGDSAKYVVGAKTFPEQLILASLISGELERHGFETRRNTGLGSAVILRGLANNDIDVYVDYSGTIWSNAMGRKDNPGREVIAREVKDWLTRTYGIKVLGGLGFENSYALAMRRSRAEVLGVKSIADLAPFAPRLAIGGDYEFFSRPEWAEIRRNYGLSFRMERQFQATFMYRALADNDIDVISAFSSDGRIAANDLVVLSDPRGVIPPYDALLLIAPARANDAEFQKALHPLVGTVSIDLMRQANERVEQDVDKATPRAAAEWLRIKISTPISKSGIAAHRFRQGSVWSTTRRAPNRAGPECRQQRDGVREYLASNGVL